MNSIREPSEEQLREIGRRWLARLRKEMTRTADGTDTYLAAPTS